MEMEMEMGMGMGMGMGMEMGVDGIENEASRMPSLWGKRTENCSGRGRGRGSRGGSWVFVEERRQQ
jgi:hypothetical protein